MGSIRIDSAKLLAELEAQVESLIPDLDEDARDGLTAGLLRAFSQATANVLRGGRGLSGTLPAPEVDGATGGSTVSSVFTRTGDVVASAGDYSAFYRSISWVPAWSDITGSVSGSTSLTTYLGANYQPLDAGLTSLAGLSPTGGDLIVGDGANWTTIAQSTFAAASHNHAASAITSGTLDAARIPDLSATYATAGHNHAGTYQPLDSDLTALGGLTTTGFLERTGSGTATARALVAADLPTGVPVLGGTPVEGDIARNDGTQWQPVSEVLYLASDHVGVGTDGDVTLDGSTAVTIAGKSHTWSGGVLTLTRSPTWRNVTVSASCTIDLNGEMIRARKLSFSGSSLTLTIHHDGISATGVSSKLGRSGGYTDATSANSGAGGNPPGNGSNLTGVVLGGAGGNGGAVGASAGGSGGTVSAGTDSAQSVSGRPTYPLSLLTGRASNGSGWRGGAGGGGGRSSTGTGGGGGSGGGFALVLIGYLDVGASCVLATTANGGAGAAGSGGNAGGGGGGGGGIAVLVRAREKLASGASVTVTATGGVGGAGSGTGTAGAAGSDGMTNNITLG